MTLRKVGDSIMLTVPPALLNLLNLRVGAKVDIGVAGQPHSLSQRTDRWRSFPQRAPASAVSAVPATGAGRGALRVFRNHTITTSPRYMRPIMMKSWW